MGKRTDVIQRNITELRERLAQACTAVGRSPDEVTIVAVTKTRPATDVRILVHLGICDIGENRDQEAVGKATACSDMELRWHFVGQVQTRKARSVASYAEVVHSVDRLRLVSALGAGAREADRTVHCLVQVNLDPVGYTGELATRGGVAPEEVLGLADAIAAEPGLVVGGVMAVAPRESDPHQAFGVLGEVSVQLQARYPEATTVSAGMSADLEQAVAQGATHLRIGAALLGDRATIVG